MDGAGVNGISGAMASVEGADSMVASGTYTFNYIGTMSATDGNDLMTAAGISALSGTMAAIERHDSMTAIGTSGQVVTGTMAAHEGHDMMTAMGTITFPNHVINNRVKILFSGPRIRIILGER